MIVPSLRSTGRQQAGKRTHDASLPSGVWQEAEKRMIGDGRRQSPKSNS